MAQQRVLACHGQDRADPPGADQFAAVLADKFHSRRAKPLHHPLQLAGIDGPSVVDRLAQFLHPDQPEFVDLLGIGANMSSTLPALSGVTHQMLICLASPAL